MAFVTSLSNQIFNQPINSPKKAHFKTFSNKIKFLQKKIIFNVQVKVADSTPGEMNTWVSF